MRFDEVSARYGEFGTFFVGNILPDEKSQNSFHNYQSSPFTSDTLDPPAIIRLAILSACKSLVCISVRTKIFSYFFTLAFSFQFLSYIRICTSECSEPK